MVNFFSLIPIVLAFLFSPLLSGIINKTKAWFAGKNGPSIFQKYRDLYKLMQKGSVYGEQTSWLFKAGPIVNLATVLLALSFLPQGGNPGFISVNGDLFIFIYLLGLGRFFTLLAAFDTGSSFEQMGASREVFYSALTEPVLLLGLSGLGFLSQSMSLSNLYMHVKNIPISAENISSLLFIFGAFFIVMLTENSRIPVDDPTTHLELTMIHEVMILDHSGVDLAFIEYASSIKLWIFASLTMGLVFRLFFLSFWSQILLFLAGIALIAVMIGFVESFFARFKLIKIPYLLITSFVLSALWIIWIIL
jgi:formate hydrogenlyase subunit 4